MASKSASTSSTTSTQPLISLLHLYSLSPNPSASSDAFPWIQVLSLAAVAIANVLFVLATFWSASIALFACYKEVRTVYPYPYPYLWSYYTHVPPVG